MWQRRTAIKLSLSTEVFRSSGLAAVRVTADLEFTPGRSREVTEWDVDEIAVLIEASLQNDGVPVGIEPQEFTEGLKAKQCGCF